MKKLRNFMLYAAVFLVALMFFTPKVQLYYALEKALKPYGVIVANEVVDDKGMTLHVSEIDLYIQGIESAHIDSIDVALFGFYNVVNAHGITLAETFIKMVPIEIGDVELSYSVSNPLYITLYAEGDFGVMKGEVALIDRLVQIHLEPSKLLKTRYQRSLREFKKSEAGGLVYEYHF